MEKINHTLSPISSVTDIRHCIQRFAKELPQQIALHSGEHQFTYQQLETHTGQIAYAISKTISKGSIVILAQDKRFDFIASILACMRLGVTFCMFDPPNTIAEKEFLKNGIDLTKPQMILTNTHYNASFELLNEKINVQCVETIIKNNMSVIETFTTVDTNDCAYIAFSSGSSSGKRKGIKLPWEALYTRIAAHTGNFHILKNDIVAQHCPVTVDAFLFEILIGLTVGATVDLVPAIVKQSATDLVNYYNKQKITIACFVPSKLKQLKNEQLTFNSVRLIFSVGEDTTTELCDYFTEDKNKILVNGYGPTEATIAASFTVHKKNYSIHLGNKPIDGLMIELRDPHNPEIIINTPHTEGEIYLSGSGIALGYIGATDEQNKRFFQQQNRKYYRTGDIGKYDNDNNLVFCYRLGNEGKLLGKLVNLSEVETAIKECAPNEIQSADVVIYENKLRSHVIINKALENPAHYFFQIAQQLRLKLTDHSLPQLWSFSKEYSSDWKSNLNNYPTYLAQPSTATLQFDYFTQKKEEVVNLWKNILLSGKENNFILSDHDNFYLIGGDSLRCTSLSSAFIKKFNIDFPFGLFQKDSTIYFLLRYLYFIHHDEIIYQFNNLPENDAHKSKQPVYFIHALLGDTQHTYERLTQKLKRPAIGFSSWGLTHAELMPESVEELASSILEKIKKLQPVGPYYLVGWSFGGIVTHAIATQLRKGNAHVCNIMLDTTCPQAFLKITSENHLDYVRTVIELNEQYIRLAPTVQQSIPDIADKSKQIEYLFNDLLERISDKQKKQSVQVAKLNALLTLKYAQWQLAADDFLFVSEVNTVPGLCEEHKKNLGWKPNNDSQIYQMPGGHFDMINRKFEEIPNTIDNLLAEFEKKLNSTKSAVETKLVSQQPPIHIKNASQVINFSGEITISGKNSFQGFFINKQIIKAKSLDIPAEEPQTKLHQ